MAYEIKFGTDGWRGLIAEDFTFANVARCAQGVADHVKSTGKAGQGLVVGYDTRFLSHEFAERVASVLAANGVKVWLASCSAPTPVVSFNVLHRKAAGAAIITASHNSGIWNGFKFKPDYAGSATQEITDALEGHIRQVTQPKEIGLAEAKRQGLVVEADPVPPYLAAIERLTDLPSLRAAGFKVRVDAMHGAGAGFFSQLLSGGATQVTELRAERNPAFPGMEQPEPIAKNLEGLMAQVPAEGASVGLALDGDADRLGVVDETGRFLTTLEVFSLLALYLLEVREERGPIVKSVTASRMLNLLGQRFNVPVHEMRVGFKYIGPKFSETGAILGGEESGGYAFRGHIPERDGILSGLYILDFMARTRQTPAQLIQRLFNLVGPHFYHRRDVTFQLQDKPRLQEKIESGDLKELAGRPVRQADSIDGRRFLLDDAWVMMRFSGTEPLLRIYAEAEGSPAKVTELLDAAQEYLGIK